MAPLLVRYFYLSLWLCVSAALLPGCVLLHSSAAGSTFLKPSQRHLRFTTGFHDAQVGSVAYRDPSEYEEYDRVENNARAETLLSIANGPQIALAFPLYQLRSLTRSWAFNRGKVDLHWGPMHYLNDKRRSFAYALYRHRAAGGQRSCMAFLRAWARPPDDPRHRPGKAFFGYYCLSPNRHLTVQQAVAVLRGIDVHTADIPRVYFGENLHNNPGALKFAQGRSGAASGNPEFPFHFSRYYSIGDGNDTLH